MPFLDHLEELRWRLFRCAAALAITILGSFAVLFTKKVDVIKVLVRPVEPYMTGTLIATHPSELFGEDYARLAVLLNDARGWAKATLPTYQDRKEFFESIVNGDPDPIALLRGGDERAVRDLIAAAQQTHAPA